MEKACFKAKIGQKYLSKKEILAQIKDLLPESNFFFYKETDSTNTDVQNLSSKNTYKEAIVVVAESQRAGKGRFSRKWLDAKGASISMSVGFSLKDKNVENLDKFTLLSCLEICKSLRELTGAKLMIKWPNDIYYNSKKLGGMIALANAKNGKMDSLVFGVGINFSKVSDTEDWADLSSATQKELDINEICARMIKSSLLAFSKLEKAEELNLEEEFEQFDFLKGKVLSLTDFTNTYKGKADGIDLQGMLKLKSEDGNICLCKAGEVTILKDSL